MIKYIDEVEIRNKRVLLRVDFNVSLNPDGSIRNDERIRRALPSIQMLLANGNKLILVTHLGQPKEYDPAFTTERIAQRLQELIGQPVLFVPHEKSFDEIYLKSTDHNVFLLDNIRFHAGEKKNDPEFANKLASIAEVYVNDAFGVCHRPDASVVGVASLLPHYGGLLVKEEVEMIRKVVNSPTHPVTVIIAGAKISTKIGLIEKFMQFADSVLIGGAIAHNFLKLKGLEIGKSSYEEGHLEEAKILLGLDTTHKELILPVDFRIGSAVDTASEPVVKKAGELLPEDTILDIGPETERLFSQFINDAKTIIWNGPLGYFENPKFAQGSVAIFNAITSHPDAISIVGGGDTLSVIKKLPNQEKITHISTGGGAMLELIEKGTLPGIEALEK